MKKVAFVVIIILIFLGLMSCNIIKKYTVTFDGNGGTPEIREIIVNDGETVDILPEVNRERYDFVEWNTQIDGEGVKFTIETEVTEDITVYAIWYENYEITNEFTDSNLLAVIREIVGKPEEAIMKTDVRYLEELSAIGMEIESLEGIQNLTNLKSLYIWNNQISDITPLENLTNLELLRFYYNLVTDISALEKLTNLEHLSFSNNQVKDISVLENLTNLNTLAFTYNEVNDISPLESLTNLERLSFARNQVSDISPIENLTNLKRLSFGWNQVSDISPIEKLTNLESLHFSWNQINNISPIENLTNLESLYFQENQVTDISPLVNNTGFGEGDLIFMEDNFLDLTPGSQNMQDIQTLIDRGVDVVYEPQRDPVLTEPPLAREGHNNNKYYDWYKTQFNTGYASYNNCGPTSVSMSILYHQNSDIMVAEIRDLISNDGGWWSTNDIVYALNHWSVDNIYQDMSQANLISSLNRGFIAILCIDLRYITSTEEEMTRYHRYYSGGTGHFIIVKGYLEDEDWFIVYDPWSCPVEHVYPNGSHMGKERYYSSNDILSASQNWWNFFIQIGVDEVTSEKAVAPEMVPVKWGK